MERHRTTPDRECPGRPRTHPCVDAERGGKPNVPGFTAARARLLDEYGAARILNVINTCWIDKSIPREWKDAAVFSFYQGKGDDASASNYRQFFAKHAV